MKKFLFTTSAVFFCTAICTISTAQQRISTGNVITMPPAVALQPAASSVKTNNSKRIVGSIGAMQAPVINRCGTVQKMQEMMQNDPDYSKRRDIIEQQTQDWIKNNPTPKSGVVVTIPVVIHVVYRTTAGNISDTRIQNQIATLNKDYARLNSDTTNTPTAFKPLAANTQIQFCLASKDPAGATTTGIIRKSTTITNIGGTSSYYQTSQGGDDIWDRNKYLNIWVCEIDGQTLGFAYLPGAPAAIDGVVIDYNYFGSPGSAAPYNLGRTATHEVGHWLNLKHIWGDESQCAQDDGVSDTPLQKSENYGCPVYPQTTQAGGRCNTTDPSSMYMNYMDYVNDNCMNIFSLGQSARMNAALNGTRASLKTSPGCANSCPAIVVTLTPTQPACGTSNGSINSGSTGGATPYTYLWSNGATTQNVTGLDIGTYSVTVTDSSSCAGTNSTTLSNTGAPTVTTTSTATSNSTACDATGTATVSGGTSPYTYTWSNGQTTSTATGLCALSYSITVTGSNNCNTTSSVTVAAGSGGAPGTCDTLTNMKITDTLVVYTVGGTGGWGYVSGHNSYDDRAKADKFIASNGDSISTVILIFAKAVGGSGTSSVDIKIWDGVSGSPGAVLATVNLLLSQITLSVPQVVTFATPVKVNGNFYAGIQIKPNGAPQDTVAIYTTKDGNTVPGTAIEMWNDGTWHTYEDSTNWNLKVANAISVIRCKPAVTCPAISITFTSTQPSCGQSNGSITATAAGGITPYSYLWTNGSTLQTATGLSSGTYGVTVTDSTACTSSTSTPLISTGSPAASTTTTSTSTSTACDGTATVSASGGSTPYTYLWSNGQTTITATGLCVGSYSITVTGSNSCKDVSSANVFFTPTTTCDTLTNTKLTDTLTVYGVGGTGGWGFVSGHNSYDDRAKAEMFTAVNGDSVNSATLLFAKAYGGNSTSTVDVKIWDGSSGTPGAALGSVTVLLSQIIPGTPKFVQFPAPVKVNGNFLLGVQFKPNGAPQDSVALFTNTNSSTNPITAWELWNDASWHTYADSTNWNLKLNHSIWVHRNCPQPICPQIIATVTKTNAACGQSNGSASLTASGGTTPYTYSWSNGATTTSVSGLTAGTYTVTVKDASQCSGTSSAVIANIAGPSVTVSSTAPACGQSNGSATAIATAGTTPYTYTWSNSGTTQTISGLAVGTYTVTVKDANQCTTIANAVLTQPVGPSVTVTSVNPACGQSNGSATASATGGATPYTYTWSNGATTSTASALAAGTYSVTVKDANQCATVKSGSLSNAGAPTVTTTSTNASDSASCNGTASATATGGTTPYTYLWSNGKTTSAVTGLCPGTYSVTVTDSASCKAVAQVAVSFNVGISSVTASTFIHLFPNPTTGFVTVEAKLDGVSTLSMKLYNVIGEQILMTKRENFSSGSFTLDFTSYPQGIYFVELMTDRERVIRRINLVK